MKFDIQGEEIDVYFNKGKIAFTYEGAERRYENAITLPSKKTNDVIAASLLLFTNALEAINENKRIRAGTTEKICRTDDSGESK